MVMRINRPAIAMIELIFAIVVMGFAMLAIPNITAQAAKSGDSAISQEAVAAAATQMQQIMGAKWDMTESQSSTRQQVAAPRAIPAAAVANVADIGDYNGANTKVTIYNSEASTATKGDYIDKQMNMASTVAYTSNPSSLTADYAFNPTINAGGTTNIKRIAVTLTSPDFPDKKIVLNSFSCSIGMQPRLVEVQK